MKQAILEPIDVHDLYVARINALLAQDRENEANDLAAEFDREIEHPQ